MRTVVRAGGLAPAGRLNVYLPVRCDEAVLEQLHHEQIVETVRKHVHHGECLLPVRRVLLDVGHLIDAQTSKRHTLEGFLATHLNQRERLNVVRVTVVDVGSELPDHRRRVVGGGADAVGEVRVADLVVVALLIAANPLDAALLQTEALLDFEGAFELLVLVHELLDSQFVVPFEKGELCIGVVLADDLLVAIENLVGVLIV